MQAPVLFPILSIATLIALGAAGSSPTGSGSASANTLPRSGGIFGYSGNPATHGGQICNSCHSAGAPPVVTLSGPTLVQAGKTYTYELLITGGQNNLGGLGVSTTDGTLADTNGETRVNGAKNELTHRQPKMVNGSGQVPFLFDWTAPITAGSVTMYGSGNSVNGNSTTSGDFASKDELAITVEDCLVDFTEYGFGTAGSGGFVPVTSGIDAPCAGGASLEILDGLGSARGFLWISDQEAAIPFLNGNLWIDISSLWIRIPIKLDGAAGVPGAGTLSLPAGDLSFAQGFTFYVQSLFIDPGAFGKLSLSNGLKMEIGV